MSDDDLIRRGDALAAIQEYAVQKVGAFQHPTLKGAADAIATLPAVFIQPMIDTDEADALAEVKRQAYREGWEFAYRQWEATGSVPPLIAREGG